MTLRQYLDGLSSRERTGQEEVWIWTTWALTEIGLGHVWKAIARECRFPESAWENFFAALDNSNREELEAVMTEIFQDWIRHGPEVQDPPVPKGKAVDANRFLSWMDDQDIFASPSAKQRFLDDVKENSSPTPPSHQQLRRLELGNNVIWATFREETFDPFADWATAQEVRTGLGLTKPTQPDDQKLFLLVYHVPDDIPVRYPTIADAYAAGSDWNPNFQCAPPNAPWGYTSGDAPEVVHEVLPGAHLIDPEGAPVAAVRIMD